MTKPLYEIGARNIELWLDWPLSRCTLGTITHREWNEAQDTWIYTVHIEKKGTEKRTEHQMSIFYLEENQHLSTHNTTKP